MPEKFFGPAHYNGRDRTFFFFSYEGTREVRSNWFRIRLEDRQSKRGSVGLRVCISIDDVEAFAAQLARHGVEARSEVAGKSTELVVTDPDGYTLLFFQTKGAAQKSEKSHRAPS